MKKSEVLSLSVALATSVAAMMPPSAHAASTECGSVSTSSNVATCSVSGGYLQEPLDFAGSKGVKTFYDNDTAYFAACSSHVSGNNSFGMTTDSTAMTIRTATGKGAAQASGCAA